MMLVEPASRLWSRCTAAFFPTFPRFSPIGCDFAFPETLRRKKFDRNRPVGRQNDRAPRLTEREFAGFPSSRCTSVVVVFHILACSAGYAGAAVLVAGQSAIGFLRTSLAAPRRGQLEGDVAAVANGLPIFQLLAQAGQPT
jgi:hypothetical protein